MNESQLLARYATCTHAVSERFQVRAHPTIWGLRYCRACGSVQTLEHGVPDPQWRAPVLLEIARRDRDRPAPAPTAGSAEDEAAPGGGVTESSGEINGSR